MSSTVDLLRLLLPLLVVHKEMFSGTECYRHIDYRSTVQEFQGDPSWCGISNAELGHHYDTFVDAELGTTTIQNTEYGLSYERGIYNDARLAYAIAIGTFRRYNCTSALDVAPLILETHCPDTGAHVNTEMIKHAKRILQKAVCVCMDFPW